MVQLQLEMLATGAQSALLAISSPHRGINIFRVPRSDRYLHQMLTVVSALYTRYPLLHVISKLHVMRKLSKVVRREINKSGASGITKSGIPYFTSFRNYT
jgi:hypothetical protein